MWRDAFGPSADIEFDSTARSRPSRLCRGDACVALLSTKTGYARRKSFNDAQVSIPSR